MTASDGAPPEDYPAVLARLTEVPEGSFRTVRYGSLPEQFGEYWPGGDGAAVVLIHGGYWRRRYRLDLMRLLSADLNARGYAVWNIEYRRMDMPGGGWPGTFDDVSAAVDAVTDLDDGAIDPARVALVGHSAGGHLALWAAHAAAASGRRLSPAVVVSLAGVCDLVTGARLDLSNGAVRELLGGGPDELPEVYRQADPMALVPLGVPQLVVHGTADEDVPIELSRRYAEAAGPEAALLTLPDADHMDMISPDSAAWPQIAAELTRLLPPVR
ncbi:alpha/beta hydrolase family protein [Actinomadura rupiterrae]|uniref:alpha/beta hydrolase family protein n=1 Tax=Actinomadura rupiterrae TaxID=559627 RepID=UPI0020A4BEA9|nr:alpha/beta fold hydrolase [Actinomadura rupiterrae]MCP2342548.1 acetyl esterase/lipase [Actinomadura rupiterrae]